MHGDSPAQTLHRVNQAFLAGDHLDDSFCTLIFAIIDPCPHGFGARLSVGGHPLPTLLRAYGTVTAVGRYGSIVGSLPDTEFYDDEIRVEPGDTVVLVTDGLMEIHTASGVTGRSEFEDRLAACAGMAPAAIVENLAAATNVNDDDIAIIALQAT